MFTIFLRWLVSTKEKEKFNMVTLTQKRARNSVFFSFPFLNGIIPSPASPLTAVLEAKEIPNSSWDSTFLSIQIKPGR